jgi:hypothetical protein
VLAQKRGEFAERFDQTHSVERAVRVGSVGQIIKPRSLRPFLIDAVQRGMRRMGQPVGVGTGERDGHTRVAQSTAR